MTDPRLDGTEIADSIVDLIGNTPLVRLKRISEVESIECTLAMKAETTNPGGSSKDRPALEMILAAERDALLRPGGTIAEPTSANTGAGLAIGARHSRRATLRRRLRGRPNTAVPGERTCRFEGPERGPSS